MVVDSSDRERIGTVKEELWRILACKVGSSSPVNTPSMRCDASDGLFLVCYIRLSVAL